MRQPRRARRAHVLLVQLPRALRLAGARARRQEVDQNVLAQRRASRRRQRLLLGEARGGAREVARRRRRADERTRQPRIVGVELARRAHVGLDVQRTLREALLAHVAHEAEEARVQRDVQRRLGLAKLLIEAPRQVGLLVPLQARQHCRHVL